MNPPSDFNHSTWYGKFPELQLVNKLLQSSRGCYVIERSGPLVWCCSSYKFGGRLQLHVYNTCHCDTGTVTTFLLSHVDVMKSKLRNPRMVQDSLVPYSLAQKHKHKIVGQCQRSNNSRKSPFVLGCIWGPGQ